MPEENEILDPPDIPDIEDPDAIPPEIPTDDHIFAYTHHQRKRIIKSLTKRGIPEDHEYQKVLLTTLKDMDASALGRKRIKMEEKGNAIQENAAALISQILSKTQNMSPYQTSNPVAKPAPTLPQTIPDPVLVDGETAIVGTQQSIESFLTNDEVK